MMFLRSYKLVAFNLFISSSACSLGIKKYADDVYMLKPPSNCTKQRRMTIQRYPAQSTQNDRRLHVIIVARWRYGSTFVGQILNQNHDFSYFYEPLRGKMYKDDDIHKTLSTTNVNLLHNLLKCDLINSTWWYYEHGRMNCMDSEKIKSSVLCNDKIKSKTVISQNLDLVVEEICRSGKHIGMKTVRVPNLRYLESIVNDNTLNVKIIQLVRDLRGVYQSRKWEGSCDMEVTECDEVRDNLEYLKTVPSSLQDHYMLLRYEDLADDPIHMTKIIYDFLGLSVPRGLQIWMELNAINLKLNNKSAYDWRYNINYPQMLNVQKYCNNTLMMLGYKPLISEKDLRNLSMPSITTLSYPIMPDSIYNISKSQSKQQYSMS